MKLLLTLTMMCLIAPLPQESPCRCSKIPDGVTPYRGHHMTIAVVEKKPLKKIRGSITDANGELLSDVVVEVFQKPKGESEDNWYYVSGQTRLAACKTGDDGTFCFDSFPPGKYVLRVKSYNQGFETTFVLVTVAPRSKRASDWGFKITLDPAI